MKMKDSDLAALELALSTVELPKHLTFDGVKQSYLDEGLSERRFRFDCLWAIPQANRQAWFDRGIYDYLNDDHIHTALKSIVG